MLKRQQLRSCNVSSELVLLWIVARLAQLSATFVQSLSAIIC